MKACGYTSRPVGTQVQAGIARPALPSLRDTGPKSWLPGSKAEQKEMEGMGGQSARAEEGAGVGGRAPFDSSTPLGVGSRKT